MKLSQIKLNKELLMHFVKKQWKFIFSLTLLIFIVIIYVWSIKFISLSFKKVFDLDEQRVQSGVIQIDLEKYDRLKDSWRDFKDGRYVLPSIISAEVTSTPVEEVVDIEVAQDSELELKSITINDTSTGWLNVRSGPGISFEKIGVVYPQKTYILIEESGGWYKIELSEAVFGWVSARYATMIETKI